jgi:NAD+ diphosphatase
MNFIFCPNCGTKGSVQKQDETNYECDTCGWHYWNNPKATASTICINDKGEILFAKRGIEPKKDMYDIPGGFLEYYEDAYKGAARKLFEESGVRIKRPQLFRIERNEYIPGQVSTCDLFFVSTEWEGEFTPRDDVAAFEWKPADFMASERFAWSYSPDFIKQLKAFIATIGADATLS